MKTQSPDSDVLWTMDADGTTISLDACIFTGHLRDLDRVQLQHQGQGGMDVRIVGWEQGKFAECWMKLPPGLKPNVRPSGTAMVQGAAHRPIRCIIRNAPPHERGWWATPERPVMVPIWAPV